MTSLPLERFDVLTLAGGGNRCWWQAGVLDIWLNDRDLRPRRLLGTSAGAGVAAAALAGVPGAAVDDCQRAYRCNVSMWRGRRDAWFAQEEMYPAWVRSFLSAGAFERLRRSSIELLVGVARLPCGMPEWLGLGLGMAAYLTDRCRSSLLHPRLAQRCELEIELHTVRELADAEAARHLLVSAAAAPPFIARRVLGGRVAMDGGFADNAPRLPLAARTGRQLILLTRHDPRRPAMFEHEGRTYAQPSRPVPISTWGCTRQTELGPAVDLGRRDAMALL